MAERTEGDLEERVVHSKMDLATERMRRKAEEGFKRI